MDADVELGYSINMSQYFRLEKENYSIKYLPSKQQVLILMNAPAKYYHILRHAYRDVSRIFEDYKKKFNWGMYINGDESVYEEIRQLLSMFEQVVAIDDALTQTFALGFHQGKLANLVYRAKPYKKPVTPEHRANAAQLTEWFAKFIQRHPAYKRSDYLLAVPCTDEKKFDLPTFITDTLCRDIGFSNGRPFVRKVKQDTKPMKDLITVSDKMENIRGAFAVLPNAPFQGKLITVIDDIYQTGTTLHELASLLEQHGARVQGLVATKTVSDLR